MELHLTKKDFKIEWYSGSGSGGQHRNKHQNCCRITHIDSGMIEHGTESKSRINNQKIAFERLAKKLVNKHIKEIYKETNPICKDVIRNYNQPNNIVHDKMSGFKQTYKEVVDKNNLYDMIEARKNVMNLNKGE